MASIRIVLIEPETLLRSLLCQHLTQRLKFNVVADVSDEAVGMARILKHRPDLVIVEPRLPKADGLQLVRDILAEVPQARVVALTAISDSAIIRSLLQSGIHGFIEKTQTLNEVMSALARLAEQGRFYSPLALEVFSQMASQRHPATEGQLSDRERDILVRLARGLTTREIGRELSISEFTVKTHRQNIYLKLNVNKVTSLTRIALQQGWVCPDSIGEAAGLLTPAQR